MTWLDCHDPHGGTKLTNSNLCNSPAFSGCNYCYFHLNPRGRRLKTARARDSPALNLPFPEDTNAVQVALAEIMWALAKTASTPGASASASTLNRTPGWEGAQGGFCPYDPNFEKHFDLLPNIDLNADPEPTLSDVSSRGGGCRCRRSRDLHWMMIAREVAQQNPLLTAL